VRTTYTFHNPLFLFVAGEQILMALPKNGWRKSEETTESYTEQMAVIWACL
jgi:hypothetical protein